MKSRFRGRRSERDTRIATNAVFRSLGALSGRPVPPELITEIKPKRVRAAPDPNDSEAPVITAVGALLAIHPKVLFAVRQNSGALPYQGERGKMIPVWFYRMIRNPEPMTITDYWGMTTYGRMFAFECKRPSWKNPRTDREIKQWNFINMVVRQGGVGSFVRGADEVKALLP